jgi:hypothetical protein
MSAATTFFSKTRKVGDCLVWSLATNKDGYGVYTIDGKVQLAHRAAWMFTHGSFPDGLCVLHRCDNPPCVNPAHLFVGTQADNLRDMNAKARRARKLTPDDQQTVRARLERGDRVTTIARDMRVSASLISFLKKRFAASRVSA